MANIDDRSVDLGAREALVAARERIDAAAEAIHDDYSSQRHGLRIAVAIVDHLLMSYRVTGALNRDPVAMDPWRRET